ncbi:uncharacterized protein BXZ73DRAFT_77568 [Epithele typhae]|uniref:uncharacterized protein n=1 Tax=Epithele typhae TaxID=378194 RepID=UPI0020087278|nr:uncharacterized protein BXZ73DRAFT_77568 [Epithele typhae]KAH9932047.1 hypothetical protein BXZ73DRAFT_77568 [Epithele typhae]
MNNERGAVRTDDPLEPPGESIWIDVRPLAAALNALSDTKRKMASCCTALSPPSAGAPTAAPERHPELYFDDEPGAVVFLVEQTLFRVHRYFLKRHSPVFAGMFASPAPPVPGADVDDEQRPPGAHGSPEGASDARPIVLPRRAPSTSRGSCPCSTRGTFDEWASVLLLADKYVFEEVKQLAIARLAALDRLLTAWPSRGGMTSVIGFLERSQSSACEKRL